MRSVEKHDFDRILNQMQRELQKLQIQEDLFCTEKEEPLYQIDSFCLAVPQGFCKIGQREAEVIYFSKNRPKMILLNKEEAAGLSFQKLEVSHNTLDSQREHLKQILKNGDARTVFYEMGEVEAEVPILWFEYKSFAADERVYNIMYLFQINAETIMGTFYCIFKYYDRWKSVVFQMLKTIRISVGQGFAESNLPCE